MFQNTEEIPIVPIQKTRLQKEEEKLNKYEMELRNIQENPKPIAENAPLKLLKTIMAFENSLDDKNIFLEEQERLDIKSKLNQKITILKIAIEENIPLDAVIEAVNKKEELSKLEKAA